jgi:hypothetical protein
VEKKGEQLTGTFRFGPGQMRVFARTARPIGNVSVAKPLLRRDLTRPDLPLSLEITAALVDAEGQLLAGSVPMQIETYDALGQKRYDLFRATDQGTLKLTLPLAANDPTGEWVVTVTELLGGHTGGVTFRLTQPASCGAMAGSKPRAVTFGNDRDNVFRFFRTHQDVKLVVGTSDFDQTAAQRLTEVLKPWGVRCSVVKAADVNKPRPLTAEEALTWVGLDFGRAKPGTDNGPGMSGFDVAGAVVLIGTPEDNPLIGFLRKEKFLPYQPDPANFPGRGRGYLSWQRDAIGPDQESVTLIGYDAEGMAEAVGTLAEAVAGMEPLTRLVLPKSNIITVASKATTPKTLALAWSVTLPDRSAAMKVSDNQLSVLTADGTLARIDASGKIVKQETVAPADVIKTSQGMRTPPDAAALKLAQQKSAADRIVKTVAVQDGRIAVGYWGGLVQVLNAQGEVQSSQLLRQDVTGLAWLDGKLVAGLANGQVIGLSER